MNPSLKEPAPCGGREYYHMHLDCSLLQPVVFESFADRCTHRLVVNVVRAKHKACFLSPSCLYAFGVNTTARDLLHLGKSVYAALQANNHIEWVPVLSQFGKIKRPVPSAEIDVHCTVDRSDLKPMPLLHGTSADEPLNGGIGLPDQSDCEVCSMAEKQFVKILLSFGASSSHIKRLTVFWKPDGFH